MAKKPTYEELQQKVKKLEKKAIEDKLEEESLREGKEFITSFVDNAPIFFVAIDAQGKTMMMNQRLLKVLGYTANEVVGNDYLSNFVPERDRDKLASVFRKLTAEHKHTFNENYILSKDGKEYLVEWHGTPVYDKSSKLQYFYGLGIDITKRKQAEKASMESENKYRNLFNNAQVGLTRTKISDGKVLESNEKMAQIFGYENKEEFINEYVFSENYVDPEVRKMMLSEVKKTGTVNNLETQFYKKDKSKVWVRFDTWIFPDKGYMEDVVVDITEHK